VRGYASLSKAGKSLQDVVLVDGVRTPFQLSGTGFKDLMAYELGRIAIHALLKRTALKYSHNKDNRANDQNFQ